MKSQKARLKALRKKYHLGEFSKKKIKKIKTKVVSMARRRRYRHSRKHYKSDSKVMRFVKSLLPIGAALAYGAVREPLATAIDPMTSKIPVVGKMGAGDEVALGGAAAIIHAFVPNSIVRKCVEPVRSMEFGRLGEMMRKGMSGGSMQSTNNAIYQ